jgi:2,4-dienoyl-CoA reductase-like NADH-dependent reductase (Old Yellow Enzyme family)
MRFMREVVARVRQAANDDVAVLVKTNLRDGFAGGIELPDAIVIARALEEEGADALVLSGGFVSRSPMVVMHGAMPTRVMGHLMSEALLKVGVTLFGKWLIPRVPYRDTYFLEDASAVRAEVRLPLVYVGGAASRASIDAVLARGFDAVAMARALIVDPAFVRRMAEDEQASAGCTHCNYCAARIYTTSMACHLKDPPGPEVARLLRLDEAS